MLVAVRESDVMSVQGCILDRLAWCGEVVRYLGTPSAIPVPVPIVEITT